MTENDKPAPLATQPPPGRLQIAARSLASTARQTLGATPITPPVIDWELTRLPHIVRAAEVLRYSVRQAEYWLSPGGTLRAVLRLSLKLALLLGLPVLIIGPVVLLLLEGIAAATAALAAIAANLAGLSVSLLIAVVGFAVLAALGRNFIRRK
jgi:hypothetical protein